MNFAEIGGLPAKAINLVDYAVTVGNAVVGFIEVKAPGKGADPHKFTDPHEPANRVVVLLVK